jgi:hypothetical protein
MSTAATQDIQSLYVAILNRPADAAGLDYWSGVRGHADAGNNLAFIGESLMRSAEYLADPDRALDRSPVVSAYKDLFGRDGEPEGMAYWDGLLSSGKLTMDTVLSAMVAGAQGNDLLVFEGKVEVATAFTAALDLAAEQQAYARPSAGPLVSAYLAKIVDAATLADALNATSIDALITSFVTPTPTGGPVELVGVGPALDMPLFV